MKVPLAVFFSAALFLLFYSASSFAGGPRLQATPTKTPTEEPTKPPYVFPTPIFIPTYSDDVPVPTRVPPVTPTRTAVQPRGEQTYVVEPGDSPSAIAKKFYGDASKYPLIMSANKITDPTKLRVGAVLTIPPLSPAEQPTTAPAITSPAASTVADAATPSPPSSSLLTNRSPIPISAQSPPNEIVLTIVNVLSAIFLLGFVVTAILAFLVYRRSRQLQNLTATARRFLGRK